MSCTNTTAMYLNIDTQICASGSASRSGNTITVSGTFSVTQTNVWNINAIYAYVDGATSWQKVKNAGNVTSGSANFSFSFTDASAGSRTYTAVFQVWNNAESGPLGGPASTTFSVSWPAGGTAPSDGHIDGLSSAYNLDNGLIEFYADNVSVSTSTALTTSQFRISLAPNTGGGLACQYVTFVNNSSAVLNQSNSTADSGGITIVPNQLYYSGIYAVNSVGGYYYNGPTIVAPAAPVECTVSSNTSDSITIKYITVADGGYYDKYIEYNLNDRLGWITGDTVSSSSSTTGTFTISNLNPYKNYTVQFRVRTYAGATDSGSFSFTLLKPKFYGSAFSAISVTGTIPENIQVASVNWTTFSTALSGIISKGITPENLPVSANLKRYVTGWTMEVTLEDNTIITDRTTTDYDTDPSSPFVAKWGITIDQSHLGTSGSMPLTVLSIGGASKINELYGSLNNQSKPIVKLYASENGRAKLIYKEK